MQRDIIYLVIAGFSIKITFYKSDYIIKGIFINQITQSYKEFIKKKINRVDFSIDFVDSKLPNTTVKNRYGYYFGLLYKKISSRKILSFYHIGLFNFQFLLKYSLYHIMAKCKNASVFHASANLVNNRVYIFIGDSGSGKSTVMRLLNDVYPAVADDSIFVKKEGGKYYFYQTPFFEKEYWIKRSPKQYSIGGFFF